MPLSHIFNCFRLLKCYRIQATDFFNQQPLPTPTGEEIWTTNYPQHLLYSDMRNIYSNSISNHDQLLSSRNHLKANSDYEEPENMLNCAQNKNINAPFNMINSEDVFIDRTHFVQTQNYDATILDNTLNDTKIKRSISPVESSVNRLNSMEISSDDIILKNERTPSLPSPNVTVSKKPKISFSIDSIIGVK